MFITALFTVTKTWKPSKCPSRDQWNLQGGSGDADMENRPLDAVREGEGGTTWVGSVETLTLPCVK